jgi:hypothetical protein
VTEANRTVVTELATALGILSYDLGRQLGLRPTELRHVSDEVWAGFRAAHASPRYATEFSTAYANGQAFRDARDGLRRRPPLTVEWKGPHRPPGDDVTPADLRIDHVFQISCKYHSRVMLNAGPPRLFDNLLASEARTTTDWFLETAPLEYQQFYLATRDWAKLTLVDHVGDLNTEHRSALRERLRDRSLPEPLRAPWTALCQRVSSTTAQRWSQNLRGRHAPLRLLWRLTRIGDAPYYLLGAEGSDHLRLRVASRWDWVQRFALDAFRISDRPAGQPEIAWTARVSDRATAEIRDVEGHVEVRWSHGRFGGLPEAKIYLDTPIDKTPGYYPLL